MTKSSESQDNRSEQRTPVQWVVQWTDGHRVRKGEIKDASPTGLFLSPAWKPTDPISPGDVLEMRFEGPDKATDFEAVVRWVGESREHDCEGLGLATTGEVEIGPLVAATEKTPETN